jgi:hypothetical protein
MNRSRRRRRYRFPTLVAHRKPTHDALSPARAEPRPPTIRRHADTPTRFPSLPWPPCETLPIWIETNKTFLR